MLKSLIRWWTQKPVFDKPMTNPRLLAIHVLNAEPRSALQ